MTSSLTVSQRLIGSLPFVQTRKAGPEAGAILTTEGLTLSVEERRRLARGAGRLRGLM
jgi:hypothetical protein